MARREYNKAALNTYRKGALNVQLIAIVEDNPVNGRTELMCFRLHPKYLKPTLKPCKAEGGSDEISTQVISPCESPSAGRFGARW